MGGTREPVPAQGESDRPPRLVPQAGSLVVMLVLFGLVGLITLLTIVSEPGHHPLETSGRTAYRPADFASEIDWQHSLHTEILASSETTATGAFQVPPPPLSKRIFPCSDCHDPEDEVDVEPRPLGRPHKGFTVQHGEEDRWCFDCHNPVDRDQLRLANGQLIGFDESHRLCGQCHGTIYRDWRRGLHGRRIGYWNGAKTYMLCAHCHDPHNPPYRPLKPLPPPVRPEFLAVHR